MVLPDGRIFFAGGDAGIDGHSTAELYDPNAVLGPFTYDLADSRRGHSATLFSDETIFLAGGNGGMAGTAEFINATNGTQISTIQLLAVRYGHSAIIGPDQNVYLIGGDEANSVEKYNPFDQTVSAVNLPAPGPTAIGLVNQKALVIGAGGASVLSL